MILLSPSRHKIDQTELHVSICINGLIKACIEKGQKVYFSACMLTDRGLKVDNSHE